MSERRPTLQEVIRAAVENAAANIYTAIPAKVVKWNASNQRANCQILIKEIDEDEEGNRVTKSVPVVTGVPVQFDGASNYRTTYPISDGTTVIDGNTTAATTGWLMFSHRSLDKYLTGNGGEVDPEFDHFHAPNDCFFLPGGKTFGAPWSSVATDHMTVGHDSGVQIHIHVNSINIGDDSGEPVVTKRDLQALYFAINAAGVVANDGGAAFKANLLTGLGSAGWTTGVTDGQLGSSAVNAKR